MLVLAYGLPFVFAILIWWLSTGVVLYVVGRGRNTHAASVAAMSGLAVFALIALYLTSDVQSTAGAYAAFIAALTVWAWHEVTFLTGLITGPRTTACPGRLDGPAPTRAPLGPAIEAVIYHEVAIALTAALIAALTWGGANQIGLWTFVILWLMRLSSKLNIYFGVKNFAEGFLPPQLRYLSSYFCRRPMNAFFPVAVTVSTVATALVASAAMSADATAFEATGYALLATLLGLAVLEHWFLVLPIPSERLWSWGLASRPKPEADCKAAENKSVGMAAA